MTSQTITNHAKTRYAEFEFALDSVRVALDELTTLSRSINDGKGGGRFEGWQVPTKDELQAALRTASADLDVLKGKSKTYKEKLIANGWRV
jgi:hypothetical protein